MGIGRREFLRLTSIALVGIAIDPSKAVIVNDNIYINKKLGIIFNKPSGWEFISVKDFGKLKNVQKIGEGLDLTTDEIWNELGEPICIATKYHSNNPYYKGIFSPTITLNICPKKEIEDDDFETFEELLELTESATSSLLKDFKITKKYNPYYINNCKFYEFDAEYLFEHVEIKDPLKVELKVLKAMHNGFYYDFNCHQSKNQGQIADKEFEDFKKTIQLL